MGSDAIPTQHGVGIGQLAGVLDEKARLAHELAGLLGQHLHRAVGAVLGVGRLLVVVLVLGNDQAFLQDHVEAGFDVVVLLVLVLLVVVFLAGGTGRGRDGAFGHLVLLVVHVDVAVHVVVIEADAVVFADLVLRDVLEVVFFELLALIRLIHEFVVVQFVRHGGRA